MPELNGRQYSVTPRPPWMYNSTPYLQEYYQRNREQIDRQWSEWSAANPEEARRIMEQSGQNNNLLPSGGPVEFNNPDQFNWPGGNVPTFSELGYDPFGGQAGFIDPFRSDAGLSSGG